MVRTLTLGMSGAATARWRQLKPSQRGVAGWFRGEHNHEEAVKDHRQYMKSVRI